MKTIHEVRRQRLRELIDMLDPPTQAEFSRLFRNSPQQTSAWLREPGRPGAKNMSDGTCRNIEREFARFGLRRGWMDTDPDDVQQAEPAASQVARLDPSILTRSHLLLAATGGYDLGNPDDAELFVDAYEWIAEKEEAGDVSPDNLVNFRNWVLRRGGGVERTNEGTTVARKAAAAN